MPSYLDQSISIQWRDRDKIEDSERYIEETKIDPKTDHEINVVGEDIIGCTSHDFYIDKHHDNTDNCENEICSWSCKGYHKLSFMRIFIIEWIDLYRFASSKMRYKYHQESYRIEMFQWIRSQSSLKFWRRIT